MNEITTPEGECGIHWGLYDLVAQQFTGPFEAVENDGVTRIPAAIQHARDPENKKWIHSIGERTSETGGKVIDSNGTVVCNTTNFLAAHAIACALNAFPTGLRNALLLGNGPYGCNHHSRKNPWDFWAIQVDVDVKDLEQPGTIQHTQRYVGPCGEGEYRLPVAMRYPLHACKHSNKGRAQAAIDVLKELLKKPYMQEQIKKRRSYGLEVKWETMTPVKIHYLTVVADPDEGSALVSQKDGTVKRVKIV